MFQVPLCIAVIGPILWQTNDDFTPHFGHNGQKVWPFRVIFFALLYKMYGFFSEIIMKVFRLIFYLSPYVCTTSELYKNESVIVIVLYCT